MSKYPLPASVLLSLNRNLINAARKSRPDVILIWRGTHILPRTIRVLKRMTSALITSYNNDDPFASQFHRQFYWYWYLRCIPEYDVNFVYRKVNVTEAREMGSKETHVLMPYFFPDMHRPIHLTDKEREQYACDVVFVGHHEADGRMEYLRALVQAGLHMRLFGGKYWSPKVLGDLADYFGEVRPVYGDEYTKALCGARMCLCFLSRLNRDTYTRRCFEIPACGCLLLSERTEDLQCMFKEDEEAVYFSTPEELVKKALWVRGHPEDAERIAHAGMLLVNADGHSVDGRMKEMLSILEEHRR